jgi:hypothetical protein
MHPIVKPSASGEPGRTSVIVCCSPLAPLVSSPPQVIGRPSSEAGTLSVPSFRCADGCVRGTGSIHCRHGNLAYRSGLRSAVPPPREGTVRGHAPGDQFKIATVVANRGDDVAVVNRSDRDAAHDPACDPLSRRRESVPLDSKRHEISSRLPLPLRTAVTMMLEGSRAIAIRLASPAVVPPSQVRVTESRPKDIPQDHEKIASAVAHGRDRRAPDHRQRDFGDRSGLRAAIANARDFRIGRGASPRDQLQISGAVLDRSENLAVVERVDCDRIDFAGKAHACGRINVGIEDDPPQEPNGVGWRRTGR